MKIYFDFNDWWVGYYRGPNHHYICPIPTVVIRIVRSNPWDCTCMTNPGDRCAFHDYQ